MPNPIEFNKKIEVSLGAIAFLMVAEFALTSIYFTTTNNDALQIEEAKRQSIENEITSDAIKKMEKEGIKLTFDVIKNKQDIQSNSQQLEVLEQRLEKKIKILNEVIEDVQDIEIEIERLKK